MTRAMIDFVKGYIQPACSTYEFIAFQFRSSSWELKTKFRHETTAYRTTQKPPRWCKDSDVYYILSRYLTHKLPRPMDGSTQYTADGRIYQLYCGAATLRISLWGFETFFAEMYQYVHKDRCSSSHHPLTLCRVLPPPVFTLVRVTLLKS